MIPLVSLQKRDDASHQFWLAVQKVWPEMCLPRIREEK